MSMRIVPLFAAAVVLLAGWPAAGADRKEEKDPDWIEFSIMRDGSPVGDFGFKTVSAASGKSYTSSKLELKGKKGTLTIQTHAEREPSGKLSKYRKWVGNVGADPDVIAFWKDGDLRIVSKVPKHRFTVDLKPGEGFLPVDRLGFHLYSFAAGLWNAKQTSQVPCVFIDKGETGVLVMKAAGAATLKNAGGQEVKAEAVSLAAGKLAITVFVGDKPAYLGFRSKSLVVLRKGWSLVSVTEGSPPPVEVGVPPGAPAPPAEPAPLPSLPE